MKVQTDIISNLADCPRGITTVLKVQTDIITNIAASPREITAVLKVEMDIITNTSDNACRDFKNLCY